MKKHLTITIAALCAITLLAIFCTQPDFNINKPDGGDPNVSVPGVPANIRASATSSDSIIIRWDSVPDATGYYIYRSDSTDEGYSKIDTVTSSTSYEDAGLSPSTTYHYSVTAYNSAGTSDRSLVVSITTRGNLWDNMSCNSTGECDPITDQAAWDACPIEHRFTATTCSNDGSCEVGDNCDSDVGKCEISDGCSNNYTRSECFEQGGEFTYDEHCPVYGSCTINDICTENVELSNCSEGAFVPNQSCPTTTTTHTLTVSINPSDGGNVTVNVNGESYDLELSTHNAGTPITVTATANRRYRFAYWAVNGTEDFTNEDNESSRTITFNINSNVNIIVYFVPDNDDVVNPIDVERGTFTDSTRPGSNHIVYETVKIGNQTWMAENLNYRNLDWSFNDVLANVTININDKGSWCYENDDGNCEIYGRLYTWEAAREACPPGWRLPDTSDWGILERAVGGSATAGTKLK